MTEPAENITEEKDSQGQAEAEKPVDIAKIKSMMDVNYGSRLRSWLSICSRCGLCADSCFFYLARDKDPEYSPAYKVKQTLGELFRKKGKVDREFLQTAAEVVWGRCTACRRCSMYCPFGIDIATMIATMRAICTAQGECPAGLVAAVDNMKASGNQMAMSSEDWVETCEWMAEEWGEEIKDLAIPVDVKGAKYMYTVNPREPMYYPQDLGMMAMIMAVAGVSWTVPTKGWDCTNLAMFAGIKDVAAMMVRNMYQAAQELGVQYILMTECGHAYRSGRFEGPYFLDLPGGQPPVPVKHSVEFFYELLSQGKIKIDPEKKLKEPVTLQDPCNVSRNGGMWDTLRDLTNLLVGDFRDMDPNCEHNHCCGGGGGFIPMGPEFKKRRMISGKVKAEQMKATGAKIIIAPCHNCFDQLNDLIKEYDLGMKVLSFKEIITESMVIPDELKVEDEE